MNKIKFRWIKQKASAVPNNTKGNNKHHYLQRNALISQINLFFFQPITAPFSVKATFSSFHFSAKFCYYFFFFIKGIQKFNVNPKTDQNDCPKRFQLTINNYELCHPAKRLPFKQSRQKNKCKWMWKGANK